MKTAIVFGASGLTGTFLLNELLAHPDYDKVVAFVRHPLNRQHDKLEILHVDFDDADSLQVLLKGDELYCCLGTTIRKAGSQAEFRKVDFEYPLMLAKLAKKNGIGTFILISALGAKARSRNFYMRTKGEVEEAIKQIELPNLIVVRPSVLIGKRKGVRLGERIGQGVMQALSPALRGRWRKYRAIHARTVAQAMVKLANAGSKGEQVFESDELKQWAKR